jgi:hypothetical protein
MAVRQAQEEDTRPQNYGKGGGGGGMDMMSGFTNLGDKIQNNSLSTMSWFESAELKKRADTAQKQEANEDRRRWEEENRQRNRGQNFNGLQMLAGQRENANANVGKGAFKIALKNSFAGGV